MSKSKISLTPGVHPNPQIKKYKTEKYAIFQIPQKTIEK